MAPFGDIDVQVPEGVQVDAGGFTLFGSKRIAVSQMSSGGVTSVVRIRGLSVFGSLKVWGP